MAALSHAKIGSNRLRALELAGTGEGGPDGDRLCAFCPR